MGLSRGKQCGPRSGQAGRISSPDLPRPGHASPDGRPLLPRPLNAGMETHVVVKVNSRFVFRVLVSERF